MDKGNLIAARAQTWIGVRWRHQGRSFDHGVDCIGLCLKVYEAAGYAFEDQADYARHSDGLALRSILQTHMKNIEAPHMQSGDLAYFNEGGGAAHVGLISRAADQVSLIHAYAGRRKVVVQSLASFARPAALFRIKGID